MSFNGSGTFLINTAGQPVVSGTVISSTAFNALTADLATGLSTAITKDGQTTVTANIPMSTYKFTGLGVGSAATDSANLSQVQSTVTKLLNSVSGADTITATASPTLAAYAAGQMFYFVATGDNTTSVTLNIDALGAKAVTRDGSTALVAADIKSGEVIVVVYDGTRFQVVSQLNSAGDARFANVSIASSLYVGGVSTFVGNAGFSANVSIASALSVGGVAAITGATTIGGNLTLSGGTANGVAYLNGSKVVTSGSALVFDGTNFGLGTASPANYANYRNLAISGTTGGNIDMLSGSTKVGNLFNDGTNFYAYNAIAGSLVFGTNNAEKARFDSSGNLGIGTASPAEKLEVAGNIKSTGNTVSVVPSTNTGSASFLSTNASGNFFHSIDNSTGAAFGAGAYARVLYSSGAYPMVFFTNDTERARITSGGNLLVGTTSQLIGFGKSITLAGSSYTLEINQDRIFFNAPTFYILDENSVGVKLDEGTTSWAAQSDERTKVIIEPIVNAVEKVLSLRSVIGRYKTDEENTRRSFLIAQDVQAVLPEAVSANNDDGGKLNLRYTEVIPLLVAAIKELKAEISALKGA